MKTARSRQKSYVDNRRNPLEFEVGDSVILKVSPWRGVVRFSKGNKLSPRYVGSFKILKRLGPVAYCLELPPKLSVVHNIFDVSNLKKIVTDNDVFVPINDIRLDDKLLFVAQPVEVSDRRFKKFKKRFYSYCYSEMEFA